MRSLLLAVLAAVVLAGCTGGGSICRDTPDLARVPASAPSEAGAGEATLIVRVLQPADPPAPVLGAKVVAAWAIPVGPRVDDGVQAAARSVRDGARADGQERFLLVTANLTTDAAGEAHLRLPATAIVQVATTAPGMTTESSAQLGREAALPSAVELVLVPQAANQSFASSLAQGVTPPSATGSQPVFTQDIAWGPRPEWWEARLTQVTAVLHWTNTPMAQAELDLEVGDANGWRASSFGAAYPVAGSFGSMGTQERTAQAELEERGGETTVWVHDGMSTRVEDLPFSGLVEGRFAGNGPMGEVCVPGGVVLDGPIDVQAYEAVGAAPRDGVRPSFFVGALVSFAVIGAIALIAVRVVRRP